jgi:four helix bundle protein
MRAAPMSRMIAHAFDELDCWQLATELKRGVYALVDSTEAVNDFKFRDQIRDSAASAPRNIAEGFGRYEPNEFKQYLKVANGSLMETANHLLDGVHRGYFKPTATAPLHILARRASAATTSMIRYLRTAKAPKPRTKEPRTTKNAKNQNPRT